MVGTLVAALGVAAAIHAVGPPMAQPLDEVGKLAQAIALSRACPHLKLDKTQVAMALARAGIRIAPMMPEIGRRSEAMAISYLHLDRKQACMIARELYGTAGTSAPGFLAER